MTRRKKSKAFLVIGGDTVGVDQRRLPTGLASSRAKKIVDGLNRVLRELTFKPKNAGRRARSKGHGFEREVAQLFRPIFPDARRHLEYQDGEANGYDLANVGEYRVQCKAHRLYAPISTMKEIQADPMLGEVPVMVTKGDGEPPVACLPLSDFIRLVKKSRR